MNAPSIFDTRLAILALAGLNGAVWGLVVSILVGSGLALLTGLELRPLLGPSLVAGMGCGVVHAGLRRDDFGWRTVPSLASAGCLWCWSSHCRSPSTGLSSASPDSLNRREQRRRREEMREEVVRASEGKLYGKMLRRKYA